MRRELVVPLQLPSVSVQRDHGIGIEIVAQPGSAVPWWIRVPGAPIGEVEIRIVRSGIPHSGTSRFPGIARPRIVSRLARCWNGVEAPDFFPCRDIKGGDETA